MRTAVWKLGGSLFDLPGLSARLATLLANHRDCRVLLVPGGGSTADLVRDRQRHTAIDDDAAHWLAIRALDFNAHLVAAAVARSRVIETRAEADDCWNRGERPVLSPTKFVRESERSAPESALPHDWTVTSDSLAAWIAARWPCDELVLLKSRSLGFDATVNAAAERRLVDLHFPQIAPSLTQIGWCNLRDERPRVERWL